MFEIILTEDDNSTGAICPSDILRMDVWRAINLIRQKNAMLLIIRIIKIYPKNEWIVYPIDFIAPIETEIPES